MLYSAEVDKMTCVAKGPSHGAAPIPQEGRWVQAKEVKDIAGLTHGVGWCAPQQGACKLTLNVKGGLIEEALVERRTLHPDNMAAGPASYGMTDTMGRMHSDAQFAGSSSVPAHVEMMGFLGMGNNPMVGASVAVAVALEGALKK
jgi:hypothetical protein